MQTANIPKSRRWRDGKRSLKFLGRNFLHWLAQRYELSRGGGAHNLRPMEGLRGFAVFLVFLVHYVTLVKPWLAADPGFFAFAKALHSVGNTGVDLFFVLSGYLIYGSLISRPADFLGFMARRVQRIYPAFLAVFAAYVVLSYAFPAENKIPLSAHSGMIYLLQNLLLLPGLLPIEPMITVAWSLGYEMFFYLAAPLVISLFGLRERSAKWRALFFMLGAALIVVYCATGGKHVRFIMFVAGVLLYEALDSRQVPTPTSLLGFLALIAGLLSTLLPPISTSASLKACALFVAFFVLCLTCFRDPSAWLPRLFSWTPLRWLGNMSYSYYLLHGLALKAGFLALAVALPAAKHGSWLFWVLLPAMFALTLMPTAVLFLLVERPFSLMPRRRTATVFEAPHDFVSGAAVDADASVPAK